MFIFWKIPKANKMHDMLTNSQTYGIRKSGYNEIIRFSSGSSINDID